MKKTIALALASAALLSSAAAFAQVAGSAVLGVEATELRAVALGWSARKQVLGKPVFNEGGQKIGTVDDIVVAPDLSVSYAIVGAGGFLGVAKHDVAVPVSQFREEGGKFILDGATRDKLQALPSFEYAR